MRITWKHLLPAALATLLVATGCGGEDATPTSRPQPTPTTAQATTTAAPAQSPTARPATPTAAPTTAPTAPPATPTSGPRPGGILKLASVGDLRSYDPTATTTPSAFNAIDLMNSRLFGADPNDNTKIVGDLVVKWDVQDGGKTYVLQLHPNIKWHDGGAFTSQDAKDGLDLYKTAKHAYSRGLVLDMNSEVSSPDTVRILLDKPSASVLARLGFLPIMSAKVIKSGGNFTEPTEGTGPFKLQKYTKDSRIDVVKHADYFVPGRPYLDGATYFFFTDNALRLAAMRTKQVDLFTRWAAVGGTDGADLKKASASIVLDPLPRASVAGALLQTDQKPWNDIRARRALSLAFDRQKAIELAGGGLGTLTVLPVLGDYALPESDLKQRPGYRQPKEADIAEAKKLWAEAGAGGVDITVTTRKDQVLENLSALTSDVLATLGAKSTIRVLEVATFTEDQGKGNYNVMVLSASSLLLDPDGMAGNFVVTPGVGAALRWKLPQGALELYQQQSATIDTQQRVRIVRQLQELWLTDVPLVSAFLISLQQPRWDYVKGVKPGIDMWNQSKYDTAWLDR